MNVQPIGGDGEVEGDGVIGFIYKARLSILFETDTLNQTCTALLAFYFGVRCLIVRRGMFNGEWARFLLPYKRSFGSSKTKSLKLKYY